MLLLDVEHKCWSKEMCEICGVKEEWLAHLYESWQFVGTLKPDAAAALGLPESVKVCAGAGDNAAAAVGTGTVGKGHCNISLGTSGTVFISSEKFGVDATNGLLAFAHADGGWHLMGCMLSAASCNKWWMDDILKVTDKDYPAEQAPITRDKLGRNKVFFLPYLMGERSPINDTDARGTLIGLSMDTGSTGRCGICHPGFGGNRPLHRRGDPPVQHLRRRCQEPVVVCHHGQRVGHSLGYPGYRTGTRLRRCAAGHGLLR